MLQLMLRLASANAFRDSVETSLVILNFLLASMWKPSTTGEGLPCAASDRQEQMSGADWQYREIATSRHAHCVWRVHTHIHTHLQAEVLCDRLSILALAVGRDKDKLATQSRSNLLECLEVGRLVCQVRWGRPINDLGRGRRSASLV